MAKKDEEKTMELVVVSGDITVSELKIKFSDGRFTPLSGRHGEVLRLDLCDPEDVKKSLAIGQLKNAIDSGWLVNKKDLKAKPEPVQAPKNEVKEVISASQTTLENAIAKTYETNDFPVDKNGGIKQYDFNESAAVQGSAISQHDVLLNVHEVKTYDQFLKLPFNYRLNCVRVSASEELLKVIVEKTDSQQLRLNAKLTLESLEKQKVEVK